MSGPYAGKMLAGWSVSGRKPEWFPSGPTASRSTRRSTPRWQRAQWRSWSTGTELSWGLGAARCSGPSACSCAWWSLPGPTKTPSPGCDAVEVSLIERGARKARLWLALDPLLTNMLADRGYAPLPGTVVLERALSPIPAGPTALAPLGGRMIEPALWDSLTGMQEAKNVIERRVILPLAEPMLAERHGVAQPKAIVLFGPPGTGKTTFAKGIASRLKWPFVEIEPAALAGDGSERAAARLAEAVDRILGLPAAVVFVDEVEDLASVRSAERRVNPGVTNEFLRQIPRLRDVPYHLLVCATNWVSRLDPAFLRPGRFDYVLPVGPPDADARAAIWNRYVTDERIDVDILVQRTELFTPADIEFAAHKAAQLAFEREHFEGVHHRAMTDEFLAANGETRPTLTSEMIETFRTDTNTFARS